MGAEQSQETKTSILNDTRVSNSIKNINETINETTMSMVQESLKQTAASAEVKQTISIKGLKAVGDIDISGIKQKAEVEISVSTLTNSEMKQDLVQDTMNKLQTQIKDQMQMSQAQASEKGEQMVSELIGAVSDTMQGLGASVTGTDTSSKSETSIQNLLNIKNETELQNLVKNAVNVDLINKTIEKISSNIVGDQTIEIEDLEAGGSIAITNVEQEILSTQMLEAVTEVGTGSSILSTLSSTTKTEMDKSIETGQSTSDIEEGTLGAAGGFVESIGEAWTGIITSMGSMIIIPILIVGGLILFMFRGTISKVAEKHAGIPQQQYYPQQQVYQGGGSKMIKSLLKRIIKQLSKIRKTIQKYYLKYISKHLNITNLGTLIIICFIIYGIYQIYRFMRYNRMEGFTSESKLQDVMISFNKKYIKNKKLGETQLCLTGDKDNAYKFEIIILEKKDIYIITKIGTEKYYMKNEGGKIKMEKYDFINDRLYKFNFEKTKENTYKLLHGGKYISMKEDCLVIMSEKSKNKKEDKEDKEDKILELLFE
jgi:hypothetical protein